MKITPAQEKIVISELRRLKREKWDDDPSYGHPLGRHVAFDMDGADNDLELAINAVIKRLAPKAGIRLDPKGDIYVQADFDEVTLYQFATKLPAGDKMLEDVALRPLKTEDDFIRALDEIRSFEKNGLGTPPLTEANDDSQPLSEILDYEGNLYAIQKAKRMLDKAEKAMKRKDYPGALGEIAKASVALAIVPKDAERHIGSGQASSDLVMAEVHLRDLAKSTRDK